MIDYTKATIDRATQDNSTQLIFQYYADQLKTYYTEMSNSLIQKDIKTYFDLSGEDLRNIMDCLSRLNMDDEE